ncbi:MAG: sulfatase-like hydrolase/transferase, partial [Acidobacteria bacterium]|nr:sulfatase-like hydrolase/transferase [Acidobacteriota bacterium]
MRWTGFLTARPRRHDLLALAMTLFLFVFESTLLGTPYRFYFNDVFSRGVGWAVLRVGGVLASLFILTVIFRASLAATRGWRIGSALLFGLVVAAEYGYVNATGGFLNAHDIRVALADSIDGLPMIQLHWSGLALVPAAVYAVLLALAGPPRASGHARRLAAALGLALALHSAYAAAIYIRGDEDDGLREELAPPMLSPQAFLRSATMLVWNRTSRWYFSTHYGGRQTLSIASEAIPTRHVVLVVDESIRGDHLSVNGYARPTTPWLDEMARAGRLGTWGVVSSATWTSNDSVLCMLTGITALPDRTRRTLTAPTIFQFAKAMRYQTHLFDGGARQLRFG